MIIAQKSRACKLLLFVTVLVVTFFTYLFFYKDNVKTTDRKIVNATLDYGYERLYHDLLTQFPIESLGLGMDTLGDKPMEQAMTYGLLLSSESLRYKKTPSTEGAERIKNATNWILDNSDLDNDGLLGWGLPYEWDAFSDGTINQAHQPYTITTAIVLNGLLDALMSEEIWTSEEKEQINFTVKSVSLRWSYELWTEKDYGGYFWYSTSDNDNIFTINASSMLTGNLARSLREQGGIYSKSDKEFIESIINKSIKAIVSHVRYYKDMPFWDYMVLEERDDVINRPNDLVHHSYILWGLEDYAKYYGRDMIPWSIESELKTLNQFMDKDEIYEFPQYLAESNPRYAMPPRIWGIGMMLALYSRYNSFDNFNRVIEYTDTNYKQGNNLSLYPLSYKNEAEYLPRFTAHVLYGISQMYIK